MALAPGTQLGPYEIVSPIGAGGMGEVYRARDSRLDRDVAIKVLPEHLAKDPDALARFEREAKAIASLSHPNILSIHDFGKDQGICFAVTELLEGETLGSRIRNSPLPWRKATEIGVAIAEGLSAAHSKGIIHRDLKPANIFLTSDGRVKILDFGLARVRSRFTARDDRTTTEKNRNSELAETEPGTVMGTMGYMSPEQVRGQPVDAPSDIFSLGCVLYEMVTGVGAFARDSAADSMSAILREDPPAPSSSGIKIRPDLERVIVHCLEKRPEERFQSARDLAFALKAVLSGSEPSHTVQPSPPQTKPRLHPAVWIGSGAALLAIIGVLLFLWLGRGSVIDSLAVLPFANVGANPGTEYLTDGLTEGIISNLARLPNLGVMSRSSVFRYKGKEIDPQAVGRELGVRAVVVGRLVHQGDSLIVSTELVDVSNNRQIWGEQYSRKMADLMSVQAEIAREISDKLRLKLSGEDKKMLARRPTQNTEAYQLYLQGRYQWNKRTLEGMQQSIEYFQQAIRKDERYALAYAGLADAYALLADYHVLPAKEVMPRAKTAAAKAVDLDEPLAEAHASLGWAKLTSDWAWPDAEREFQRALQLNPNYATAHQWYAEYLILMGRFDQALIEMKRAQELEPVSLVINRSLASTHYYAGQYDQAIEQCRKTILMDPDFVGAHIFLGRAYEQKGAHGEAIAAFQKALELSEGNSNELAALGYGYAAAGNKREALRIVNELQERSHQTYVQPIWVAVIYAALGDKDRAFEWLQKGYQDRSGWLVYLKVDPLFNPLRSDPRFSDLLQRVGLPS